MNRLIQNQQFALNPSSMISRTTYSSPLQQVSSKDLLELESKKKEITCRSEEPHGNDTSRSEESQLPQEHCITFPMHEFADFYFENLPSPEFTVNPQFDFPETSKYTKSNLSHNKIKIFFQKYFEKEIVPQKIINTINLYKNEQKISDPQIEFDDDEKISSYDTLDGVGLCLINHFNQINNNESNQSFIDYNQSTNDGNIADYEGESPSFTENASSQYPINHYISPSPMCDSQQFSPQFSPQFISPNTPQFISRNNGPNHHQYPLTADQTLYISPNQQQHQQYTVPNESRYIPPNQEQQQYAPPNVARYVSPNQQQQFAASSYSYCFPVEPSSKPSILTPSPSKPKKESISKPRRNRFLSMDISEILSLKLSVTELINNNLICRFMRDQIGSRYLQNILKSLSSSLQSGTVSQLVSHLISNKIDLVIMSEDIYSNYLIQLFFIYGTRETQQILFEYFVYPSTLRLCRSKYGCRVIQKILSCVTCRESLILLVESFENQTSGSIHDCLLCCNTNHVIQAMIELKLPFKCMEFIKNTLERDLSYYSENIYACRVVQAFIKTYGDKLDVNKLLINDKHLSLSQLKYGNYVIQCIIDKKEWYSNLSLINKFRNRLISDVFNENNVLYLSKDKHGSNVIETCIKVSNTKQIDYLINNICSKQGFLLKQMISDRFGNYVPKTLISFCNKSQMKILINTIHLYITNLYNYYHPKHKQCAKFITMCQQIKYQMDQEYYGH